METHELVWHPNFAPSEIAGVSVRWKELPDGRLMLRYRVSGCGALVLPEFRGMGRSDDLWETTCFELFLYDGAGRYREFNFSPSQQWAAYRFHGYRSDRENFEPVVRPDIRAERGQSIFMCTVFLDRRELEGVECAAISAVLEEKGKRPSYWALVHNGMKPDFHDPGAFRLSMRPAKAA